MLTFCFTTDLDKMGKLNLNRRFVISSKMIAILFDLDFLPSASGRKRPITFAVFGILQRLSKE
jgi:hypothetical protein